MPDIDPNSELYKELYEACSAFFTGAGLEIMMEEEIMSAFLAGITGATREETLAIAQAKAGALLENIVAGTTDGIAQTIVTALEKQIGVDGLAKELKDKIGLTPQRAQAVDKYREGLVKSGAYSQEQIDKLVGKFTDKQISERAKVIANTEMRDAMSQGEDAVQRARGARFKSWSTSGDGKVSLTCELNEAQGPIPIDDSFQSGDDLTPGHPDCRCSIIYSTSNEQLEREKDRAEERAAKTKDSKAA